MKSIRLVGLLSISVFAVACATGGAKPNAQAAKYSKDVRSFATNELSGSAQKNCPTSGKTWRKETWRKVMKMANDCVKKNKWSKVGQLGRHLATTEPHSPWGAYYLSLAAERQGNLSKALWMVDLAMKKSPRSALVQYQKGRVHWALDEYTVAVKHFNQAVKYDSKMVEAHQFVGQLQIKNHQYKDAIRSFEKVVAKKPTEKIALTGMAEAFERLGKMDKALQALDTAIFNYPRDLNLRLRQANIQEKKQQNFVAALSSYKKIRKLRRQKRLPGALKFNVDDKIKTLEAMVRKTTPGEKISARNDAKGVK